MRSSPPNIEPELAARLARIVNDTSLDIPELAATICARAISAGPIEVRQGLLVINRPAVLSVTGKPEVPKDVVVYHPRAAAATVAAFLATAISTHNLVILGSAALAGLLALRASASDLPPAECALFWIVYRSENHTIHCDLARASFAEVAEYTGRFDTADFREAHRALLRLECIREIGSEIEIAETIILG